MVYLICFEERFHHAKHYLGFVESNLEQRLERHRKGIGSKLLKAVNAAGIKWEVVKTWPDGDRNFERKLKNRGSHCRICPICKMSHG
jgi:hypothetical protein